MNKPITAYAIYDGEGDIVEFSHVSGAQAWSNFTGIGDKETGYYQAITRLVNEGFTCWEVTICPEGWVCVPKELPPKAEKALAAGNIHYTGQQLFDAMIKQLEGVDNE